jgi:hypothetical protein
MDIDILFYFIGLLVAFWAGIQYAQVRFLTNIGKNPEKFIVMLEQIKAINDSEDLGLPEDAIEVRIEKENDIVFAYEKVSGQFLAQAQSLHLAMVEATKRYPGKKFWHPELKKDTQTSCNS